LDGKTLESRTLVQEATSPRYATTGDLLFARHGAIYAAFSMPLGPRSRGRSESSSMGSCPRRTERPNSWWEAPGPWPTLPEERH
jgi:hypothetical protein